MNILHSKIKHGLSWRWQHYSTLLSGYLIPRLMQARVMLRWYLKRSGVPHKLNAPLVVSLTSYPPRYKNLAYSLRCLLNQTVKADCTILWIAHEDFSLLPSEVLALQAHGLEIRTTKDTKSYKKIVPTLDAFPDAYICTADDDLYYWPTWLEEMIGGRNSSDHLITCHRAHEITFDLDGRFNPYIDWIIDTRKREENLNLFPTSGYGVLYPPGILAHTADDREAAYTLCPHADDIWLYWMARRNGATYKTVGQWRELITWQGSQKNALWIDNLLHGGNDRQIKNLVNRYGYPANASNPAVQQRLHEGRNARVC